MLYVYNFESIKLSNLLVFIVQTIHIFPACVEIGRQVRLCVSLNIPNIKLFYLHTFILLTEKLLEIVIIWH